MKKILIPLAFCMACAALILQIGCDLATGGDGIAITSGNNNNGSTIAQRYLPAKDQERVKCKGGSFGDYLRNLKLKPHGSKVYYYNGEIKNKKNVYDAVVDMEIGNKDLQQCADAVMRLRAEYLFAEKKYDEIHFNFTSGFNAQYSKWKQGYRINVSGNKVSWVKTAQPSNTYAVFRKYLDVVFTYAGTLSLSKELKAKKFADMQPGDVFIKGGSPGHAVLVADMVQNTITGQKYFMLLQSYMPAQETQVLINPTADNYTVWYELDTTLQIITTPEWEFTTGQLKSF